VKVRQLQIDSKFVGRRRVKEKLVALLSSILMMFLLFGTSVEVVAQQGGKRVYQRDTIGNIQYHKQSWVIKDGKLCPTDTLGNIQHHKPCLAIGSADFEKATRAGK